MIDQVRSNKNRNCRHSQHQSCHGYPVCTVYACARYQDTGTLILHIEAYLEVAEENPFCLFTSN